ncbi:MAG: insulinase family protein [Myxococcales bacterium]|nr:insulinase family protein [Myxococcales bacterium]
MAGLLLAALLAAPPIALPHHAFRLDNGLQVLVHVDARLPLVAVDLSYRVGSADEPPGRTGFAHLFEHLMFMGTARAPRGAFDAWMEAEGAWNNAWTSEDRTDYYAVGPAHTLPLLLWLEADRMAALGGQIDAAKLDLQRDVVRNERRQNVENTPYGLVDLHLPALVFPPDHPYHHPVIGSHEDLQAATVADVQAFFQDWYGPANATLVVAGAVEPAAVEALVRQQFGWIPRGRAPVRPPAPRRALPAAAVTTPRTVTDRVDQPRVILAWPSPAEFAEGDAAMDVLSAILANGKSSRLHQALVYGRPVAQDVYAGQWSRRLGSQFVVWATARAGTDADALEAALREALAAAIERLDEDDVQRAVRAFERTFVTGLESVSDRAAQLNAYLAAPGDPDYVARDLARYQGLNAARVREVAQAVLRPGAGATLRVLPEASR